MVKHNQNLLALNRRFWLKATSRGMALVLSSCLLALLSGCQVTPPPEKVTDSQLERWIREGDFKQTIEVLEQRTPISRKRIATVTKQARDKAELEITYAKRLALQHRWKDSIEHLENVIAKHPHNLRLSGMLASVRRQEKNVLRESDIRVLIQQAAWVNASLNKNKVESKSTRSSWKTNINKLSLNMTRNDIFDALTKHYRRLDPKHPLIPELINSMTVMAHTSQQKNLVETLRPIKENEPADEEEPSTKPGKDTTRVTSSTQRANHLYKKLNRLMERGNLIKARETLSQIQDLNPTISQTLKARLSAVESFLNEQASHLSAQGDELYRKGHFEQARTLWMLSARLNPLVEETLSKIARSERVLKNLHDLRNNEGTAELQTPTEPNS